MVSGTCACRRVESDEHRGGRRSRFGQGDSAARRRGTRRKVEMRGEEKVGTESGAVLDEDEQGASVEEKKSGDVALLQRQCARFPVRAAAPGSVRVQPPPCSRGKGAAGGSERGQGKRAHCKEAEKKTAASPLFITAFLSSSCCCSFRGALTCMCSWNLMGCPAIVSVWANGAHESGGRKERRCGGGKRGRTVVSAGMDGLLIVCMSDVGDREGERESEREGERGRNRS